MLRLGMPSDGRSLHGCSFFSVVSPSRVGDVSPDRMAQMKTRISTTFGWADLVVIATTMTLQMCAEAVKAEANRKAQKHAVGGGVDDKHEQRDVAHTGLPSRLLERRCLTATHLPASSLLLLIGALSGRRVCKEGLRTDGMEHCAGEDSSYCDVQASSLDNSRIIQATVSSPSLPESTPLSEL